MTLKATARSALVYLVGKAAETPLLGGFARRYFGARAVILVYHAVWREGDPRLALFGGLTDRQFRADLERLSRIFRFVSLDEAIASAPGDGLSVCVTFDDGFDLVAGGAAEALAAHGACATAFVNTRALSYEGLLWQHALGVVKAAKGEDAFVRAFNVAAGEGGVAPIALWTDFVSASRGLRPSQLAALAARLWSAAGMEPEADMLAREKPYMDAEGVKAWLAAGQNVGFHSRTHAFASALTPDDLDAEYIAPGLALAATFGLTRVHMAYPFGARAAADCETILAKSGAFASLIGTDPLSLRGAAPETLGRLCVDGAGLTRELFGEPLFAALTGRASRRAALS